MEYLNLYNNNRQYILESRNRKYPNVSYLKDDDKVVYSDKEDELDKDVLDSLVAVVICDGKTNNDSDKDVIKNLVDPDNPFVLTGFNWKLNSGYGKYETDFNDWILNYSILNKQIVTFNRTNIQGIFFCNIPNSYKVDIPSFKVNVDFTVSTNNSPAYYYWKEDGTREFIYLTKGINILPTNYASKSNDSHPTGSGFHDSFCDSVIIKQIPSFQGALVTDGVDDMITSTKTAAEMGITNEATVISMIHQLSTPNSNNYTNTIRNQRGTTGSYNKIENSAIDKTGIYGYSFDSSLRCSIINNILGDKQDYSVSTATQVENIGAKYSVQGWISTEDGLSKELSSVAWYWTIIAKKVLTTDQINQIIKYYNLDKYIVPDVYYNVKKQGITNENHSDFSDKLIDYSGNNKDLQLYNFSWDNGSGIGKFNTNFQNGNIWTHFVHIDNVTSDSFTYSRNESSWVVFSNTDLTNIDVPSFKIKISGLLDGQTINYSHYTSLGVSEDYIMSSDGEYTLPSDIRTDKPSVSNTSGFRVNNKETDNEIIITILPEEPYALVLDGVDDYGKAIELPIYKDYTFIIDRQIISIGETAGIVASKSESSTDTSKQGAFLFEYLGSPNYISSWSFYKDNGKVANTDFTRGISYQSKYSYNGVELSSGTSLDSDKLWLGIVRDKDSRFANMAIYSLMSFPYSMSEFLIERQLKMYNLGTLYPGMVEFRPTVNSNTDYKVVDYYIDTLPAVVGNYYQINSKLRVAITTKGAVDEVTQVTVGGVPLELKSRNGNRFTFDGILSNISPQNINITIDEYIRFEDIVQPYPMFFEFTDENGNLISWGGKAKVGSTITRTKGVIYANLLEGLYTITNPRLNGVPLSSSQHVVEKSMVFTCTATYLLDDNEPKCILSPSKLRIPNSSYSILGYIPDISGHGNNFTFNNFLFSGMSGANGYQLDFKTFTTGNTSLVNIKNDSMIEVTNVNNKNGVTWINLNKLTSINLSSWTIKVTGMKSGDVLGYYYSGSEDATTRSKFDIREDGTYSLPKSIANSNNIGGIAFDVVVGANSTYRIEQIGEYEGSICFDGVDDFILNNGVRGGKQIIMKCNWWSNAGESILYDQRGNGNEFAIFNADSDGSLDDTFIAYSGRSNGNTYIDGILNSNIHCRDLKGVTHNITHTNELNAGPNHATVRLGCNNAVQYFTKMALYDFMLFDNISTDDKIKQLNEYVGIEAKVELPPYYWDAYGKTNLDEYKATIQQRGVAVGDYDLTNYNHAYDKMSGYGGYSLGGFDKSWASSSSNNTSVIVVSRNPYDITLKKLGGNSDWEFNNTELKVISNPVSVKFKSNKNIRVTCDYHYYPVGGNSEGAPLGITSKDLIANKDAIITISPISQENIDKYNIDVNRGYYLIYFQLSSTLAVNEEVTIEMLPLYPNGLVYDGVDDYSKNENIPVLTDYTIIAKRLWINKDNPLNEQFIHKGAINTPISESAFMLEYEIANDTYYRSSSYGGYINIERSNRPERIVYQTSNSYNGTSITKGSGTDTTGIVIGGVTNNYWKGVFYKLMLYSKTLPLLQINYLKNLMERDEIIDLNNSIFIK